MNLSIKRKIKLNHEEEIAIDLLCKESAKLWNKAVTDLMENKEYFLANQSSLQLKSYSNLDAYLLLGEYSSKFIVSQAKWAYGVYKMLLRSKNTNHKVSPPNNTKERFPVVFRYRDLTILKSGDTVRLFITDYLKTYLKEKLDIVMRKIDVHHDIFKTYKNFVQLVIYPPKKGISEIIVVYEKKEQLIKRDNHRYLSIDLGCHNYLTCYDSTTGSSFIVARGVMSLNRKYHKKLSKMKSQWARTQLSHGVVIPKTSKHALKVEEKKKRCMHNLLHQVTSYITKYCVEHNINTVVIGDLIGLSDATGRNRSHYKNQKFIDFSYATLYKLLKYKLALKGISLFKISESYTSQCSPTSPKVSQIYASGQCRVERGLFKDGGVFYNADSVGAYNILRKFLERNNISLDLPLEGLVKPRIIKYL